MCEAGIIIALTTAIVSTALTTNQAVQQAKATTAANKRAQEGIREQAAFNRQISIAKAIDARDKAVVETLELQKAGLRAAGRARVLNLTGLSARRVARGIGARALRRRQLVGFSLDSAENQARNEIAGAAINARNQQRNLSGGVSPGFAIAASAISGLGRVAGAANGAGFFDPGLDPAAGFASTGLDQIDTDFSDITLLGGFAR